jgi:hypothetical protein
VGALQLHILMSGFSLVQEITYNDQYLYSFSLSVYSDAGALLQDIR